MLRKPYMRYIEPTTNDLMVVTLPEVRPEMNCGVPGVGVTANKAAIRALRRLVH